MERLPAEHPAASNPPGRVSGEPEGHPGGVGTMTLQRPPGPSPDDAPAGATLAPEPPRDRSRSSLSPRNWKVRTKLAAVLLVPAIAFLVIASINMAAQIGSARDYGRGANVAEFGRQASTLVHELQAERDIAAGWVAEGRRPSNQKQIDAITTFNADPKNAQNQKQLPLPSDLNALQAQQHNVDVALSAYQSADASLGDVSPEAQAAIDAARAQLAGLPQLRQALGRQLLTQDAITGKYTAMITDLLNINRQIGVGTDNTELNNEVAGLTALGDLKETLSQERALLYSVTSNGGLTPAGDARLGGHFQFGQQEQFSSALAERLAALQRFRTAATTSQVGAYDAQVNGQAVLAVKRLEDSITADQNAAQLTADAEQWYSAATTYMQAIRGVETGLLDQVVSTTQNLRSDAQRQAITTGVIIAAILVIAFLTSLLIARSMIGPLRRLQAGARDVAEVRLPEAIARLQRPDAPAAPDEVEPIGIDSRDEIGEVARRSTSCTSGRSSWRPSRPLCAATSRHVRQPVPPVQILVERQLTLIDELERGEQDPDRLAELFKLDHLATRMRRNDENLLVLAGEDAGRQRSRPPLMDVLRAAHVRGGALPPHRVDRRRPDIEVVGHAVNDLVHLVAELLENATAFSPPEIQGAGARPAAVGDGGAMVEIEDRGIGMSPHEISDANERLAHPPEVDVAVSRMMGLFVVGRLATRHGITVRLRQSETGGVSAFVRIPIDVLANRFDPRAEDTAGGPPPMAAGPDGRPGRPAALAMPPAPGPQQAPGPRPLGPGPATDLPRRPLGRPGGPAGPPDQPVTPGSSPLPRRTPAQAAGGDGASAGAVESMRPDSQVGNSLPVNGAMPANGAPSGRPVLPPGATGPGRPGGPVPPGDQPVRPPLPMRGAPDAGSGPRPVPPLGTPPGRPATPGPLDQPYPQPAGTEERTPIFEQLQSEWFRQRPASPRPAPPGAPTPAGAPAAAPQPAPAPAANEEAWASPADEGWRAAERLLQPTSGGTTRAGLPMRVPQAHLMPGGADAPSAAPPEPVRPAYRSPEAVRSRLASYHQGVRRGRHADRAEDGDNRGNPSELVQQSQEKS